jgi:hypothetical protein
MKSPRQIAIVGLQTDELPHVRALVLLLRHPDPVVAELTRQALAYLAVVASTPTASSGHSEGVRINKSIG